jgi:hypothetical protein
MTVAGDPFDLLVVSSKLTRMTAPSETHGAARRMTAPHRGQR